MIVGTGVDLAEVPRVRHLVERFGRRFIERVYTPAEIAYVERKANRFERFAARLARPAFSLCRSIAGAVPIIIINMIVAKRPKKRQCKYMIIICAAEPRR